MRSSSQRIGRRGAAMAACLLLALGMVCRSHAASAAAPAQAAPSSTDLLQALAGIYSNALISQSAAEFCASEAPPNAAQAARAHQSWKKRHEIDELTRQFERLLPAPRLQAMQDKTSGVKDKLRALGAPSQGCASFIAAWDGADMDMHRKYPLAYGGDGRLVSLQDLAKRLQASRRDDDGDAARKQEIIQPARPVGTVYTLAQMHAVVAQWWRGKAKTEEARHRMQAAGRIYVRGKVVKDGDRYYLRQNDGVFGARVTIAPDGDVSRYEGQTVTMGGTVEELPSVFLYLANAEVVQDPSALQPSSLPEEPGLFRMEVAPSRIRTAPAKGVQPGDIVAVLLYGHNTPGVGIGMAFTEDIHLLLRDGTAYDRTDVPPADLDVKASKAMEPQHWARWERTGKDSFRIIKQDDRGRPDGTWTELKGFAVRPWPADQRVNDSFMKQHFYGTLMGGGTSTRNTVIFKSDGRFETIGSALSSTGGMQAGSGFTGSSSSHSDGQGTTSTSGASGGGAGAYSQGRRNDGDEHRGRYRFDGYTVELRFDSGRVERLFSFAWDDKIERVYLMGESYSSTRDK